MRNLQYRSCVWLCMAFWLVASCAAVTGLPTSVWADGPAAGGGESQGKSMDDAKKTEAKKKLLQAKFTKLKTEYDSLIPDAAAGSVTKLNRMKEIHVELVAIQTEINAL